MLKLRDVAEAGSALVEKGFGLALEAAGTVIGNDRLRDAGRTRQEAGSERLMAFEEEAKAGEAAKGGVKQVAGVVTRRDDLREEGEAQREKASDEAQAAKHETKAAAHRRKAEAEREVSERLRRA